jgi:hypothetical protein
MVGLREEVIASCCFYSNKSQRAVSSIGRAFGLHPKGRGFETLTAHPNKTNKFPNIIDMKRGARMTLHLTSS